MSVEQKSLPVSRLPEALHYAPGSIYAVAQGVFMHPKIVVPGHIAIGEDLSERSTGAILGPDQSAEFRYTDKLYGEAVVHVSPDGDPIRHDWQREWLVNFTGGLQRLRDSKQNIIAENHPTAIHHLGIRGQSVLYRFPTGGSLYLRRLR
ncbi:hypothetical protein HYS00_03975 [Candidatus Microgenomates bacterium]|nr:hypothetical protein [Candidatus Microgenomates bacterium]